jgi:putative holliday junction resolvase
VTMLALDYGERRIGVAVSDSLGLTARPLQVLVRGAVKEDVERIRQLVQRQGCERIVVGLPLNMDGSMGPQARRARTFAGRLRGALGVEVVLWDERLTTVEADNAMISSNLTPTERRAQRDAIAAAILLQDYLDAQRGSEAS